MGLTTALALAARSLLRRRKPPPPADFDAIICPLELAGAQAILPFAPLPLSDLTFAVKDIFAVAGTVTGFGHALWAATHEPEAAHAAAVAQCLAAGASARCKTVMDELAFSLSGENCARGTPLNPAAPGHLPGGSSSGSAVAVAAGLVDFALATDTAGSIRVPAAFCGIFGLRPTHGAVSAAGVLPMSPSLDAVGFLARDAATMRKVGDALLPPAGREWAGAKGGAPPPVKSLIVADDLLAGASEEALACCAAMLGAAARELRGARAERLSLSSFLARECPALAPFARGEYAAPSPEEGPTPAGGFDGLFAARAALRTLQGRELWAAHGGWIGGSSPQLTPDVASRVAFAATVSEAAAAAASAAREEVRVAADLILSEGVFLLLPTVPGPPPRCGLAARPAQADAWRSASLRLLCLASFAGLPQLHVPIGRCPLTGLPIGVSLLGGRNSDHALLALGELLGGPTATDFLAAAEARPAEPPKKSSEPAEAVDSPAGLASEAEADALRQQGNAAFKAGDYASAAACYSQGIALSPASAVLFANRAMALLKLGDFAAAEADCDAALAIDGGCVKALLRRGTARIAKGELKAALADFAEALRLEPGNRECMREVARLKALTGEE